MYVELTLVRVITSWIGAIIVRAILVWFAGVQLWVLVSRTSSTLTVRVCHACNALLPGLVSRTAVCVRARVHQHKAGGASAHPCAGKPVVQGSGDGVRDGIAVPALVAAMSRSMLHSLSVYCQPGCDLNCSDTAWCAPSPTRLQVGKRCFTDGALPRGLSHCQCLPLQSLY